MPKKRSSKHVKKAPPSADPSSFPESGEDKSVSPEDGFPSESGPTGTPRKTPAARPEPSSEARDASPAKPKKRSSRSRQKSGRDAKPPPARKETELAAPEQPKQPPKPERKTPTPEKRPPLDPRTLEEFEQTIESSFLTEEEARRREPAPISADPRTERLSGVSPTAFLRPGIPPLNVVMITPELAPAVKIGGLADVVFGLSRELEIRGNSVEIILPKYDSARWDQVWKPTPCFDDLWVPWYDGAIHCTVYFGLVHDRRCFFIEPHSHDRFFERGKVYGDKDDTFRFAFFSRAATEFLLKSGKRPDIIHCHDSQTALVPVFLYEIYEKLGMDHSRVCYTIHNFKHQGLCGREILRATGLNRDDYFFHPDRLGWHLPDCLNLMKGGIVYSNFVTTVSPTYAGEAKDRGNSFGLEGVLRTHHIKYGGVLNGIDCEVWNPASDSHIPAQYDLARIDRKYENKRALRERLLLSDNERPIIAYVGRLDSQKGLDLVRHSLFYCVNHGAQFVLLGTAPEEATNEHFRHIRGEINENPDSHLEIRFDEELSHLIYAGADMIVVPSRFEPCGLAQLIAMRYGTIPIVRAVGGLADTVFDKDYSDKPLNQRNGYVFHHDDTSGIESALSRAICCYYVYPKHFRELMNNAMRSDYSWNVPGQHYLNIYDHIRKK